MDILLIAILFILSFLLFIIEVFVVPGIGIAGIASAGCLIAGNMFTFFYYGLGTGLWVLGASLIICIVASVWIVHTRALDRISLKNSIDSTAATPEQLGVHPGDKGYAVTRLALIGNASIEGKTVEVKSAGGFIEEGTPVIVTEVSQALILVKPCK